MTDDCTDPPATAAAWLDRVAYHRDRAIQETRLAECSKTAAGRTAHRLIGERHAQLMASAQHVVEMADPEMPHSSSLHVTGWLMRQSYSDQC